MCSDDCDFIASTGVHVELNMSSLFMLTSLMACDSWSMDNFSSK